VQTPSRRMAERHVAKAPPKVGVKRPPRSPWAGQRTANKRVVTGRALQRARESLFKREPLCRPCKSKGYVTRATIRDHIKPLAEGGTDTDDNIQPICTPCHTEKTQAESRRGAIRARKVV
jgi:5-methylcytosine-specific restriction protein A